MDTVVKILLTGRDMTLPGEFDSAVQSVPGRRFLTNYVQDLRQATEIARSRRPHVVCVDAGEDARHLASFSRELAAANPEASLVAIYRPDRFVRAEMESTFMLEALRAGVQDFLHRPISSTELRQLFDRLLVPRRPSSIRMGSVMSFISNKGGVGKSTLSVNTACLLAERHPEEVLLVDASLQLGICALMLDLIPSTTIVDAVRERDRLDETLLRRMTAVHASGLHLLAAPVDATEAAQVDDESVARILNLARRTYRYTLVDTFPMLESLVIMILDSSDLAFVVMQGTAPNVAGITRYLPVLNTIGLPPERQRIILSQNYKTFVGDLTVNDIEGRLKRRVDYIIPYKKKVLRSMNTGSPCILSASRRFGFGLAITELVEDIEQFRSPATDTSQEELPDISEPEAAPGERAARA